MNDSQVMKEIHIKLNGEPKTVSVEPGELLLDMLRNRLGLTGTKRGCEVGECGACTVLIDSVPTASCLYLAALADGHEVTTIEGVSRHGTLSVIQEAFVEKGAIQCGFCTPGFILASMGFLKKHPQPTDEEIRYGLAGNMCRCGAYGQIIEAVKEAARRLSGVAAGEK